MKRALAVVATAALASSALAQSDELAEAPVQDVTNPQIGASYTVDRLGTLVEVYQARSVTLNDVAIITADIQLPRAGRGNRGITTIRSGTVLVRDDDTWFCTLETGTEDSDQTRGRLCYADRDDNGIFDAMRLQRSRRNLFGQRIDVVPYERRDVHSFLQPTNGIKSVLIFDGYSNGQVKLRKIAFFERPSRPESTERIRVDLPDGEGRLEVDGLAFEVQSVSQDRITLTRLN